MFKRECNQGFFFNLQSFVVDERTGVKSSRRHRQNVSRTDFEQICSALFSSDEEAVG